jgi:hypothetical protein
MDERAEPGRDAVLMRTRDKLRVEVKVRCTGCGASRVAGNAATVEPGTRVEQKCKTCGATIRGIVTQEIIDKAIADFEEMREVTKRLASGEIGGNPINYRRPRGKKVKKVNGVARDSRSGRRVASDQVRGAAKLYHYAIYVRHPWGTDRIVVGVKKRSIQDARDAAWDKVGRVRKTGQLKIMDAVPMRWTPEGWVETRRTRVGTGNLKQTRRARSRPSARQTKRKS